MFGTRVSCVIRRRCFPSSDTRYMYPLGVASDVFQIPARQQGLSRRYRRIAVFSAAEVVNPLAVASFHRCFAACPGDETGRKPHPTAADDLLLLGRAPLPALKARTSEDAAH